MERPRVWLLEGARRGDNDQIATLAQLCGFTAEHKPLTFSSLHHAPGWLLGASLAALTPEARSRIAAPWPDLVISAGRRTAPVAQFIKRASGGRSKLVVIGRPRMALSGFDLVLTTPQYGLPDGPNVLELSLPFALPKRPDADEVRRWTGRWAASPRPLIGVAVGAAKYPQRFGMPEMADLARLLQDLVAGTGGTLIVMASPRTEAKAFAALRNRLGVHHFAYGWEPRETPYQAALALCDRWVVTSDSLSMVSEALATGRPVSIFRLPVAGLAPRWTAKRGFAGWLAERGLLSPPRDTTAAIDRLIDGGYAGALGSSAAGAGGHGSRAETGVDGQRVKAVARVQSLLLDKKKA